MINWDYSHRSTTVDDLTIVSVNQYPHSFPPLVTLLLTVFPRFLSLSSLSLCRSFSLTLLPVSLSLSFRHSNYLLPVPLSLSFCHSLPLLPVDISLPLRSLSVAPPSLSLRPPRSPPPLSTVFLSCLFLPLTLPLAPAPLQSMRPRPRHCLLIKERCINSMIWTWPLLGTVTKI